jgi:putative membrane protein
MRSIVLRWFFTTAAVYITPWIIPGIWVRNVAAAALTALFIGLLNIFIRPVLNILALPVRILTLGLFSFVINAALLWFTSYMIRGFEVESFFAALAGSVIISIISSVLSWLFGAKK